MFSSKRKKSYQTLVKLAAMPYRPGKPFTGPIRLDLTFVLPRPKNLKRKSHPEGRKMVFPRRGSGWTMPKSMMGGWQSIMPSAMGNRA